MKELTIIIPFLNEGDEIKNTLKSIRDTVGDKIDVILINDCCTDNYNYKSVAQDYDVQYYENSERKGVAQSRDIGVAMSKTPYFLLLDGHMRFAQNDWLEKTMEIVKRDDRAIYCLQCKPLLQDFTIDYGVNTMGACINLTENDSNIMEPYWICDDPFPDEDSIEIPCVLGACYLSSKNYWLKLKGLQGLITYGSDEPFISLKAWLEGGRCILLKEIVVGHIFRKDHPFWVDWSDRIYNRLLMAELLLPVEYKKMIFSTLYKAYPQECKRSMSLLVSNKEFIQKSKKYFEEIFTREFDYFIKINQNHK